MLPGHPPGRGPGAGGTWGTGYPHGGSYATVISNHAYGSSDSPLLAVSPGATYSLKAWVRGEIAAGSSWGVWIIRASWYDANQNYISLSDPDGGSTPPMNWTEKGGDVTAPANAAFLKIQLYNYMNSGWVAFDDVALERTAGWDADYTYPAAGQPRPHAVTADGTFTYDYAGNRVKNVEGSVTTLYPFPHFEVVKQSGQADQVSKYYFAYGQRVAERTGPNATDVYYHHPDHLGSANIVTNSSGAQVKFTEYEPFGATRSDSGSKSARYQFAGAELDSSTWLYYMGARYYDPALGRFIQPDPLIPGAGSQALNRYSFVLNNPLRYVDLTGHEPDVPGRPVWCGPRPCSWRMT